MPASGDSFVFASEAVNEDVWSARIEAEHPDIEVAARARLHGTDWMRARRARWADRLHTRRRLSFFTRTEMDWLVIGDHLFAKKTQPALEEQGDWRHEFELD